MAELQRIGNSAMMRDILKRVREIQAELAANPEAAKKRDAEIDADRAALARVTNGATHAHAEPQPDKHSRRSMRIANADD